MGAVMYSPAKPACEDNVGGGAVGLSESTDSDGRNQGAVEEQLPPPTHLKENRATLKGE